MNTIRFLVIFSVLFAIQKYAFSSEAITCYNEKQVVILEQWKSLGPNVQKSEFKILGPSSYASFVRNVKELKDLKWDKDNYDKIFACTLRIFVLWRKRVVMTELMKNYLKK